MATIQTLAREMLDRMERRTRDNGERFWVLAEGAPDWMEEAAREAHGTDMMPDDYRFAYIAEGLEAIATGDADADADDLREEAAEWAENDVDVYTHDLLAWMGSNMERYAMVDDWLRDNHGDHAAGGGPLAASMMACQATERREVAERLIEALEERAEDDDDPPLRPVNIYGTPRQRYHCEQVGVATWEDARSHARNLARAWGLASVKVGESGDPESQYETVEAGEV